MQKKTLFSEDEMPVKSTGEIYSMCIHKVLEQCHPGIEISNLALATMNSLVQDVFGRLADESSKLSAINGKSSITSREIQTAVKFLLPGKLGEHAMSEGRREVAKYAPSAFYADLHHEKENPILEAERASHRLAIIQSLMNCGKEGKIEKKILRNSKKFVFLGRKSPPPL